MQTIPRTLVTGLIILVVIVGLGSLAYPSAQVPVYRTEAFTNTSSYTYLETLFTVLLVPYSTAMTTLVSYYYQPGNFPGCDPASSACNYGIPNAYVTYSTSTYSQFSTSFYQLSLTTRSIFTSKLTDTNYQNIPLYSAAGLSNSQFIILTALILLIAIAVIGWTLHISKRTPQPMNSSNQA
ncbi:MAG TPA: hypothetical protein VJZ03_04885 [Candidatus Bathyarchaeia archaeon]|nr:hypothetical protein [Candidatus Bathyarchaeia archaeon]